MIPSLKGRGFRRHRTLQWMAHIMLQPPQPRSARTVQVALYPELKHPSGRGRSEHLDFCAPRGRVSEAAPRMRALCGGALGKAATHPPPLNDWRSLSRGFAEAWEATTSPADPAGR